MESENQRFIEIKDLNLREVQLLRDLLYLNSINTCISMVANRETEGDMVQKAKSIHEAFEIYRELDDQLVDIGWNLNQNPIENVISSRAGSHKPLYWQDVYLCVRNRA